MRSTSGRHAISSNGDEVRLILALGARFHSDPNAALVKAVTEGKIWYEWITKGEICTMRKLAKRTGFNENQVSRILDLAVLSQEITGTIYRGDHDPSLAVVQLTANL